MGCLFWNIFGIFWKRKLNFFEKSQKFILHYYVIVYIRNLLKLCHFPKIQVHLQVFLGVFHSLNWFQTFTIHIPIHWKYNKVKAIPLIMKKNGVLKLALQLSFWVIMTTCNSLYFYTMNVIGQIAWVTKLQLTIYMVQLIATQLQLCQNHSFSTTTQLHYNYSHNVIN
jgi:hypothetical protein